MKMDYVGTLIVNIINDDKRETVISSIDQALEDNNLNYTVRDDKNFATFAKRLTIYSNLEPEGTDDDNSKGNKGGE